MDSYNLCIVKPNQSTFSETFIQEHILRLQGNKTILYGGDFPLYKGDGKFLLSSKIELLSYLIQKKIFKKTEIAVRTKALKNYLKEQKIDIVFAEYGMVGATIATACREAKIPLIIHFHGADAHHHPTIEKYNYKAAFEYASAIIAVSEDMMGQLISLGASPHQVFLVPCGIDIHTFKLLDISNTPPHFLSIGRFVEKKSPLSIVKAFQIVTKTIPEAHLWMVGDGVLLKQAKTLTKQLNIEKHITFMGVLSPPDIRNLMKAMRCFVQHSVIAADGDMEGSPVAILEASSVGLPVVSTNHAGIKKSVINNETGFLVDEYDIETMAERMIQLGLSAELATTMGLKGRQHMINHYQIENQIAKLDQIIKNCLQDNLSGS